MVQKDKRRSRHSEVQPLFIMYSLKHTVDSSRNFFYTLEGRIKKIESLNIYAFVYLKSIKDGHVIYNTKPNPYTDDSFNQVPKLVLHLKKTRIMGSITT